MKLRATINYKFRVSLGTKWPLTIFTKTHRGKASDEWTLKDSIIHKTLMLSRGIAWVNFDLYENNLSLEAFVLGKSVYNFNANIEPGESKEFTVRWKGGQATINLSLIK